MRDNSGSNKPNSAPGPLYYIASPAARRRKIPFSQRRLKIGAIDVPFNWLFVMIAGGAILLSAFAFVAKQRKAFNAEIADALLRDLGAITAGAATAKGTSQTVDIPDSEITLACTDECTCTMNINGVEGQLKDNLVFGQDKLKGTKLILWAQDWSLPLRVTNFLFVTTPRVKYYVLSKSTPTAKLMLKQIKERIPDNILVDYIEQGSLNPSLAKIGTSATSLKYQGHDAVRFVMISDTATGPMPSCSESTLDPSFYDVDVSCVAIRPENPPMEHAFVVEIGEKLLTCASGGKICFKSKDYHVVGEGAALAAVFSENNQQFKCNMQRAYKRLSSIAQLTASRSNKLECLRLATIAPKIQCGITYYYFNPQRTGECQVTATGTATNALVELETSAKGLSTASSFENSLILGSTGSDTLITKLKKSITDINTRNSELLRNDCPLLY